MYYQTGGDDKMEKFNQLLRNIEETGIYEIIPELQDSFEMSGNTMTGGNNQHQPNVKINMVGGNDNFVQILQNMNEDGMIEVIPELQDNIELLNQFGLENNSMPNSYSNSNSNMYGGNNTNMTRNMTGGNDNFVQILQNMNEDGMIEVIPELQDSFEIEQYTNQNYGAINNFNDQSQLFGGEKKKTQK
jgi:hypothetical protein